MARRTRREFLEDSMFTTAAAVAATSPGQIFASSGPPSATRSDQPLRVAVVGLRGRGKSHLGAFASRKDTRVTYLCDVDPGLARKRIGEVSRKQGGAPPRFVTDIRRALDDRRVDIVAIATPNHWHALAAIWAMQAGKDVYVEKPVSHNVVEGRRMVQAARKYQRICQAGLQARSNPGMRDAIRFVHAGNIGQILLARGLCYKRRGGIGAVGRYQVPSAVDYDMWLGPASIAPLTRSRFHFDWHWQDAYGNGDLGNQGVHQMDICRWGLGVGSLSETMFSMGGRFGFRDAGDHANTQVVMHDYGGKKLIFEVRGLASRGYRDSKVGVIFEGTDGFVVMTSYHSGAAFDRSGEKIEEFRGQGDHFDNFVNAVRSRRIADLSADIEEGHVSSALCHLGNIAHAVGDSCKAVQAGGEVARSVSCVSTRQACARMLVHLKQNQIDLEQTEMRISNMLRFDPTSERFIDHDAANALLNREYRKPFIVPDERLL